MALALLVGTLATALTALGITTATSAGASTLPTVTAVAPNTGQIDGGTTVVITGTGFTSPATVDFGSTAATGAVVNSSTQITVTSPPGSLNAISVDITVTDVNGTSLTSPADNFQYAVNELEDCYATTSEGNQSANNNSQIVASSSPASVLPGGDFTLTYSDPGNNSVPSSSGGYGISGITNTVNKFDVPADTTVISGPTITQQGYYYAPATPTVHTALVTTLSLINDAATPAGPSNTQNNGQEIEESIPANIPGGDNYVLPTITVGLQMSSSPTLDSVGSGILNVQPVGTASSSTDPGASFVITVTGTPVGNVAANTSCWPFPSPQPPFVTTNVIDAVQPSITIASPGNASQVVENAHVAAAFGCTDPPAWGNGLAYCTATNDGSPITNGTLINTSSLGPHTVTVTAANNSGTTQSVTSTYTVIAPPYNLVPPTVTITTPTNGAQYITGSIINANYSCTANSGSTTCNGSVANGTPISTTAGYHTFTVSALDTRGNPTTVTVGYYARTSNTNVTLPKVVQAISYSASSTNSDCSVGSTYYTISFSTSTTKDTCNSGTNAEIDTQATAPAASGGQLAVGDTITVQQQIYKPGYNATAAAGGYYSGPYAMTFTLTAPAGTKINGPITTSSTGLPSSTFSTVSGGVASAAAASACNYGANATTGTGACNSTPAGNQASTTTTAAATTTVGAFGATTNASPGSTTVGAVGSTTVGAYGSTTVNTLFTTTVAAASNAVAVDPVSTPTTIHVASVTAAPSAGNLEVAGAVVKYTGTSTSTSTCGASAQPCFTGVAWVSGSGTMATGGTVNQPLNAANIATSIPLAAVTGIRTSGTNQVTVATTGGSGSATFQYTGDSTSATTCGTQPCLTGVTYVSGSGTIAKGSAVLQTAFPSGTSPYVLPATSVTGFTTAGSLNVTLTGGPGVVAYTGTSTTAATCGAAACFTGATVTSGTGTAAAGSAISQLRPNISTFTGSGVLPAASVTGFTGTGTVTAATSNGTNNFTYTGTSTTAGTCGSAACFTGVTTVGGATGTLTSGGALTQVQPNISTFTGSGVVPVAAVTGFQTAGTITAATSNGVATFTYTGTSTTAATCGSAACFTGVTTQNGATGTLTATGAVNQVNQIGNFAGSGVLPVASVTGFSGSGTITAATSNGTNTFTYTGTSTTAGTCGSAACFTGVTTSPAATGTLTTGGAVSQAATVVTSLNGGSMAVTSSTGFAAPGLVSVAVSGGTAYVSFTGTGTGTLTGATYQGGATGTITPSGSVVQANGLTQNLDAFNNVAASSTGVNVNTFTGSGTLNLTSATSTPFTAPGTVEVDTTNGVQTVSFTGISGNTLTGASSTGSGIIYTGDLVGQAAPTAIQGATSINGVAVSGYNWSVPVSNASSVGVIWNDSSCENNSGVPVGGAADDNWTSTSGLPCDTQEQFGMDGSFVYLKYELTVTSTGTITMPGLPVTISSTNNDQYTSSLDSGTLWGTNPFDTTAAANPGISWTAVDPSPPTATLSAPIQGAVYSNGQVVDASYSCGDTTSGVTITSCTGIEDAGTSYQQTVANGAPLNTSELIPNEIHTFTVTATNSEGYTSTSYATFTALANPPVLVNQTVNDPIGTAITVPFNYSGTYPANLSTEQIVTQPVNGTVSVNPVNGSFTYTSNNAPVNTDSFQWEVSDTAGNPANVETVNINMTDTNAPMITVVSPPPDGSGSYSYQSVVDASYSCSDLVPGAVISCTASQNVNGAPTSVPNGSPIDTSSLIVGNQHCMTITAVNFFLLTTNSTVCYTVNTPAPVANNDTASTINPNSVTVPVLNNDTSIFPINASSVTVVQSPTYGTTTVEPSGAIKYTPTSASTSSVTTDTFKYTVEDTDSQVSNEATVTITIYPVPVVTGVLPISGPLTAGTPVVITGTGFATASQVYFGTTPAVSFSGTNTSITAIAPAAPGGVPGTEDITVKASGGTSATSAADEYTWDPVPTVTSVSPRQGIVAGGQTITVNGTGFAYGVEGVTTVDIKMQAGGDRPCESVAVNTAGTQLTCTSTSSTTQGLADVLVTTPGGATTAIPADQFTYFAPAPSVTSISPNDGPPTGGTPVTITGNSFTGATSVCFGTDCLTGSNFTVNSNTTITVDAPSGAAGSRVDVTVTGPSGTSSTLPADQFTYGPEVTSVSPSSGPAAGGTAVTITGAGLSGATVVDFGTTEAEILSNTDTSITTTAPPGTGTVNVTVTTPNGVSPTSSSDTFTYLAPKPSVSSISPVSGPAIGGTVVTINGNGFTGATTVSFGTNPGTIDTVSNSVITATSPSGSGAVDITVTTPGGTSSTSSADVFTYGPFISGIAPAVGSTSGGTTVTLTGTGLSGATSVNFGATAATPVSSTATSITVVTPPGTAGSVSVYATVGGVQSNVKSGGFTYTTAVPTVSSISPSSGPAAGGTTITIAGNNLSNASQVYFGTTVAAGVQDGTETDLTATAPPGTAGSTVAVTVVTPGGTSAPVSLGQYTYGSSVSHVSPASGLVTGGTTVTITGTGLSGASAVNFGTTPGTIVTDTATSITVTSPAGAAGTVDITVVVGGAPSPTSPADQFTFKYPVPSIGAMTPNVGVAGNTVTLTGTGFANATTVSFGANPGTIVTDTSTSITVTVPAGTAKSVVDVTVTGPGGTSPQTENFTYGPVVTSVSPTEGSHLGGTTVTVKGAGFTGETAVDFGTNAGSNVVVNATGTSLTVTAPAGTAGSVDITVTAGGVTSNTGSADLFTYI